MSITKGSVKLENVTISDCDEALDIQSWTHSTHVLEIENCKFENNNKGLTSENSKLNFVLKSSLLKNNNYGVNIVNKAGVLLMTGKIESCSMTEHLSSAIYLDDNSYLNISILRSTFERNVKTMVYHSGTFNQYIFMYENDIKFTRREAIQVIFNRVPNVFDLGIRDNAFVQNWDKVIDVRSGDLRFAKVCAVKIQSNTFTGNVPSGITSGILFIGFQGLIEISNNDFRDNQCNFVCKFDLLGKTRGSGQHASFVNNVVENNYGFSRNVPGNRINKVSRFAIGIFGCVFQSFSVNHNIFNNKQMDKELLVGREGDSEDNKSQVNATHNWWGTSAVDEIENRIFDFSLEDWSDRDLVKSLPAFIFRNFTHLSETAISPNNSVLGGFINFPKQLTADNSPYVVERDLTVGRNANITIDRGVTLLFKPRVGLLVLGNIFAMGSTDEPIRFCSSTDRCKEKQQNPKPCSNLRISRRSNSRDENYLEIFIKNSWKHICGENFDLISAKVACRELGFGDVQSFATEYCYPTAVSMYEKSFQCSGSERSLLNCATLHDDCYRHYCVNLACKPGYTWGNIRISSFNNDISTVNDDTSVLQNVLIDNSGSLYNGEKGPSVQIINRSPGIRHVRITNSGAGGIQIISPKSLQILENVTVNPGCSSSGIEIIGNRGSVIVTKSRIFRSRSSALVMMPMKNIALAPSYLGLPNLCGCQSRLFVNGRSYLYLSGHKFGQNERQCSKVVYSSEKTILILRVLNRPSYSSYSSAIEVYDGSAANFTRIARFDNWNRHQDYSEFQTSSNSMFLKASYGRLEKGFLAEIIVVNETGEIWYSLLNTFL